MESKKKIMVMKIIIKPEIVELSIIFKICSLI